jgi:RNA polymerase sigma-70 factor (ECF subfamily)
MSIFALGFPFFHKQPLISRSSSWQVRICLQSHDRVVTRASVHDHPIPQTGKRAQIVTRQASSRYPIYGPLLAATSGLPSAPKMTRYSSLSLTEIVCLCADEGGDEAWQEFVSRVKRPISLTIIRTASRWGQPSRSLIEDLVQVTYLKLWEGGCCLLRDFAMQRPDAILGYLKKTAANATHDYFKHGHSQSSGGDEPHVSTSDVDPQAGDQSHGSEQRMTFGIFLDEIDAYLKRCSAAPDQERDRMIFWLYFRQGMSAKEIASLPTIGLGAKGVGSVIERLKHGIRKQILGIPPGFDDGTGVESKANSIANSY